MPKGTPSSLSKLSFRKLQAELTKRQTRLKKLNAKKNALQSRMDRLDAKIERVGG